MASGDAQRVWFPEMKEELKIKWNSSLPWDECIKLCHDAYAMRTRLREEKGIKDPRMLCKKCGKLTHARLPSITLRSMLFELKKNGILDDDSLKSKDKEWKKYQRKHKLDGNGNPKSPQAEPAGSGNSEQPGGCPLHLA